MEEFVKLLWKGQVWFERNVKKILVTSIVLLALYVGIYSRQKGVNEKNTPSKSNDETFNYELNWREATSEPRFAEIVRTLTKFDTGGCPEFYVKQSIGSRDEFLIACSPDGGRTWVYYQVWPTIQKLLGPFSNFTDEPQTPPY